jgi:hypothetical protein
LEQDRKVRENLLRRAAVRQGYFLSKSRRRDPRAIGYGTWGIWDPKAKKWVYAADPEDGYGLTLDQVEDWLLHRHER